MFVLKSKTRGDDVSHSTTPNVVCSRNRAVLEQVMQDRQAARETWLADNQVPPWQQADVIVSEVIEEVPEI